MSTSPPRPAAIGYPAYSQTLPCVDEHGWGQSTDEVRR
jgi:hypothetical protein